MIEIKVAALRLFMSSRSCCISVKLNMEALSEMENQYEIHINKIS